MGIGLLQSYINVHIMVRTFLSIIFLFSIFFYFSSLYFLSVHILIRTFFTMNSHICEMRFLLQFYTLIYIS